MTGIGDCYWYSKVKRSEVQTSLPTENKSTLGDKRADKMRWETDVFVSDAQ